MHTNNLFDPVNLCLSLGALLIVGYFFGLVAEKLYLPRVTAYLFAGILFSDEFLGHLLHLQFSSWSSFFSQVCLGFIAYTIGGEINLSNIIRRRRVILITTFLESSLAVFFVWSGVYLFCQFFNYPFVFSLILASVSATTAPAATVAVINQYKTKGELTDTCLGVVALDDSFGIIIFSIIASIFFMGGEGGSFLYLLKELLFAFGFGVIFGLFLKKFSTLSISNEYLFPFLVGIIFICVGLGEALKFSSLLCLIIVGVVGNHLPLDRSSRVSLILPIQHIEEFIFMAFFTLAGTHFSLHYFYSALDLILVYVILRALGKYSGAYLGVLLTTQASTKLKNNLGLTLLPQAGVAIGLCFKVLDYPQFEEYRALILNIILGSTIVYEIIGPLVARFAFKKAGELA